GHRADVTCPNSRRESELGSIQWLVIVEVYREWPITGGGFFRARESVFAVILRLRRAPADA
ncbi:MAG TPA: hypothetical protein VFV34_11475, partial [Blastocatellia bacterium]|nr:hypothetical protein [Blastocatellia bacterium]